MLHPLILLLTPVPRRPPTLPCLHPTRPPVGPPAVRRRTKVRSDHPSSPELVVWGHTPTEWVEVATDNAWRGWGGRAGGGVLRMGRVPEPRAGAAGDRAPQARLRTDPGTCTYGCERTVWGPPPWPATERDTGFGEGKPLDGCRDPEAGRGLEAAWGAVRSPPGIRALKEPFLVTRVFPRPEIRGLVQEWGARALPQSAATFPRRPRLSVCVVSPARPACPSVGLQGSGAAVGRGQPTCPSGRAPCTRG